MITLTFNTSGSWRISIPKRAHIIRINLLVKRIRLDKKIFHFNLYCLLIRCALKQNRSRKAEYLILVDCLYWNGILFNKSISGRASICTRLNRNRVRRDIFNSPIAVFDNPHRHLLTFNRNDIEAVNLCWKIHCNWYSIDCHVVQFENVSS